MAKIGKIAWGATKVALGSTNLVVKVGLRAVSGPLAKWVIPDLKVRNIVEESGEWIKDGFQDMKEGLAENA